MPHIIAWTKISPQQQSHTPEDGAFHTPASRFSGLSLIIIGSLFSLTIVGLIVGIPLIIQGIKRIRHEKDISVTLANSPSLDSPVEEKKIEVETRYLNEVVTNLAAIETLKGEMKKEGLDLPSIKALLKKAIEHGNAIIRIKDALQVNKNLINSNHFDELLGKINPLAEKADKTVKELLDFAHVQQDIEKEKIKAIRDQEKLAARVLAAEAATRARDIQVAQLLEKQKTQPQPPNRESKLDYYNDEGILIVKQKVAEAKLLELSKIVVSTEPEALAPLIHDVTEAVKQGKAALSKVVAAYAINPSFYRDEEQKRQYTEFFSSAKKAFDRYTKQLDQEVARINALPKKVAPIAVVAPSQKETVKATSLPLSLSSLFQTPPTFSSEEITYNVTVETSRYGEDHLLIKPVFTALRRKAIERPQHATILLADVSGSMEKAQDNLRNTVKRLAKEQLPVGDTLTLIAFGVGGKTLMSSIVLGSSEIDLELNKALVQLNCNQASTNISSAFEQLSKDQLIAKHTRIVLLTDGQDNSGKNPSVDSILEIINTRLGEVVPVDTIGMTTNINQVLLSGISQKTQGAELFVKEQVDIDQALTQLSAYLSGDRTENGSVTLLKDGKELQTIQFPQIPMGKESSQVFDCLLEGGNYTLRYSFGKDTFDVALPVNKATIQLNPKVIARQIQSEFAVLIAPRKVKVSEYEKVVEEMNAALDGLLLKINEIHPLTCSELEEVKANIELYKSAYNSADTNTTMSMSSYTSSVTSMGGKYLGNLIFVSEPIPVPNPTC